MLHDCCNNIMISNGWLQLGCSVWSATTKKNESKVSTRASRMTHDSRCQLVQRTKKEWKRDREGE